MDAQGFRLGISDAAILSRTEADLLSGRAGRRLEKRGVVGTAGGRVLKRCGVFESAGCLSGVLEGVESFFYHWVGVCKTATSHTFNSVFFISWRQLGWLASDGTKLSMFRHFSWSHWQFSPHVIFPFRHLHCLLTQRPLHEHWREGRESRVTTASASDLNLRRAHGRAWPAGGLWAHPSGFGFLGHPASLLVLQRTPLVLFLFLLVLILAGGHQLLHVDGGVLRCFGGGETLDFGLRGTQEIGPFQYT